jgi:hypothetical protein
MKTYFFLFLVLFIPQSALVAQDKSIKTTDNDENGTASPLCGGVERWAVKVLTDVSAPLVNYTPVLTTIDSLIHIPTTPDQNAPRILGIEFQTYTIHCKIIIKKNESDNDYHLVIKDGNETMIGEVPDPVCAAAASSAHVDDFIAARNWVNTYIGPDPVSNVNIAEVDITGVSFVDMPHGQTGAAPNQMEIHPILNIRFSDNTGINDTKDHAPAFKVSVNPSVFSESTHFHITSYNEMFGKCSLVIYSLSGEMVKNIYIPGTSKKEINYTFSRNGLTTGMYIYRILNNESILYEGKIIIQ